jgi:hypothetical protein
VRSFNRDHEDDIVYVFEKMGLPDEHDRLQALFQHETSAYPGLLEEMSQLKFKLLSNFLRESLANPKLNFYTFLKLFILENQFLGGEMEKHFKQVYRLINCIPHHQLYAIGSYNHFDSGKAELLLMTLLEKMVEINDNDVELTRVEHLEDGFTLKLRKKIRLPKFNYESIVSEV